MVFSTQLATLVVLVSVLVGPALCQTEECDYNDTVIREENRCIWFGQCTPSPIDGAPPGSMLNCYDNNPARNTTEMGDEFYDLLVATCPQYAYTDVCCNEDQLNALATQIKYPQQLFSRCPACLRNFMDHFCITTCDPDQSLFMVADQCITPNGTNYSAIATVDLYLSDQYAANLYQSCSNVQYPQGSNRVLDLMCGDASQCNASLWLAYLGDTARNQNSPFDMHYTISSKLPSIDGVIPSNYSFMSCNTTDPLFRCSCADCNTPDLCPNPPSPRPDNFPRTKIQFSIIGVGTFLSTVVFIATLTISIYFLYIELDGGYTPISGDAPIGSQYKSLENDSPTSSVGSVNADDIDLKNISVEPPPITPCMPFYISGAHLENLIKIVFYHWGRFVAKFWLLVIFVGVGLILAIMLLTVVLHVTNVAPFLITTDPVKLWSAPTSRARQEKNYFDDNFSPFYRSEMIIITAKNKSYSVVTPLGVIGDGWTFGPVFDRSVILDVYDIQRHLQDMEVYYETDNGTDSVTLSDICYKPLNPGSNSNEDCAIMSVINYFQNNYTRLTFKDFFTNSDFRNHVYSCTRDPTMPNDTSYALPMPCLGSYGGPVDPNVALGGFNERNGSFNYQNATALIVTFTVNNHVDDADNTLAKIWEQGFLDYISTYTSDNLEVSYMAERSIEDELTRESKTDISTVALSYFLMFAYITIFLGHIRKCITIAVDMKITIGLLGVLMVLMAVVGSICLLNLARIDATLIIIEVVPFLVLAVGVDNLFIIVHSFERQSVKLINSHGGDMSIVPRDEIIGRAIAEVAPSLLLTSLSETAAFLLGGVSTMPAVRTFSFYAGLAVFINFLLQVSVFLAALSLDVRRQLDNRYDILCCFRLKGLFDPRKGLDVMHTAMTWFANVILNPMVRPFILLLFGLTSTFSLASIFNLQIGLDQNLALPKDSYLNNYFDDLFTYLHTGSPVYFVIKDGFNYSDTEMQAKFCSAAGCSNSSIGTEIFGYSRNSSLTTIAEPPMLWLDTYFAWIVPRSQCCGKDSEGKFCLYPQYENSTCKPCLGEDDLNENQWPNPDVFYKYIHWFLNDNPGTRCPSGGHAAFKSAINFHQNDTIKTSYVMTYHTIMTNSSSFIAGLKWARQLGEQLSEYTGVTIFPYSVFYVYYEQYLTTIHDMCLNIGLSLGAVFVVTFLLTGLNLWAALIIILVVAMILMHMVGCMAISGINANAVSLVNLVMTVGIAVEFCSHIVRWFCSCSEDSRVKRAHSALANMGASVVSGITLTKLLGIFVLFFAKSQIFEVYYFRMYMFMLLWGALHGLVFLPVLLSFVGPSYVPIKVRSPYRTSTYEVRSSVPDQPSQYKTSKKTIPSESKPTGINQNQGDNGGVYPSLPNIGTYDPSAPPQQAYPQQAYPQPTYPGQRYYQDQGQVYQPSETTRLLSS